MSSPVLTTDVCVSQKIFGFAGVQTFRRSFDAAVAPIGLRKEHSQEQDTELESELYEQTIGVQTFRSSILQRYTLKNQGSFQFSLK